MKKLVGALLILISGHVTASGFEEIVKHINHGDYGAATEVASGFTGYLYDEADSQVDKSDVRRWIQSIKSSKELCDSTQVELSERLKPEKIKESCDDSISKQDSCLKEIAINRKIIDELDKNCLSSNSDYVQGISSLQKHSSEKIILGIISYKKSYSEASKQIDEIESQIKIANNKKIEEKKKIDESKRPEKEKNTNISFICQLRHFNKISLKEIDKEKQAGKISGYVDADRLQKLGKGIVNNDENISNLKKELKEKHNYKFKESDCKY